MPAFLRALFAEGPRHYVDIVTDTLHASSSDLIIWNTLAMIKDGFAKEIRRELFEITRKVFGSSDHPTRTSQAVRSLVARAY